MTSSTSCLLPLSSAILSFIHFLQLAPSWGSPAGYPILPTTITAPSRFFPPLNPSYCTSTYVRERVSVLIVLGGERRNSDTQKGGCSHWAIKWRLWLSLSMSKISFNVLLRFFKKQLSDRRGFFQVPTSLCHWQALIWENSLQTRFTNYACQLLSSFSIRAAHSRQIWLLCIYCFAFFIRPLKEHINQHHYGRFPPLA